MVGWGVYVLGLDVMRVCPSVEITPEYYNLEVQAHFKHCPQVFVIWSLDMARAPPSMCVFGILGDLVQFMNTHRLNFNSVKRFKRFKSMCS